MPKTKVTKVIGEYARGVVSEDGVNYRHERQDMTPIIEHINFLNEKVNSAPKSGNRNDWHYLGSTTPLLLHHWCRMVGVEYDAVARNRNTRDDLMPRHMTWLRSEMSKLALPKKKSSMIVVP